MRLEARTLRIQDGRIDQQCPKEQHQEIHEKGEEALERGGVPLKSQFYGSAGYNILRLAHSKSEGFDLVVIGSRGRSPIMEMFFGSTSSHHPFKDSGAGCKITSGCSFSQNIFDDTLLHRKTIWWVLPQ